MEGHRSEEEADHDRTSAYHRDNGYHGAVQTQCIEICKVGGGEEYADENDAPVPAEWGGLLVGGPPQQEEHREHHEELVNVIP